MTYNFPADVQQLITQHLATGQFANEDELIRYALKSLSADAEDDASAIEFEDLSEEIMQAVDAIRAGEKGTPISEAFQRVQERVENELRSHLTH